jgi:protoporphyrinogen oxidase
VSAQIGILGGGLSGLALASFLERPCEVLEREARPGGLMRTYGKNGFFTDVGGHIIFSRDPALCDLMVDKLGDNVERRHRNNRVLYGGRYLKYPFENDLGSLPKDEAYACLIAFLKNDAKPPPHDNFLEWMRYAFGRGITEKYLLPYNRKIWKIDPAEMGTEWVERIPRPPVEDVVKSALGIPTEGYQHQLHFFYPRTGGIESLIRALGAEVKARASLCTGHEVTTVRRDGRRFIVNGERSYDEIVSTMPVLPLLSALGDVPASVLSAARGLRANALRVVMLGIGRREGLDEMTAVYIPDPRILPHRVCFNCAFSPTMAPEGCASVACEITTRPGDGVHDLPDEELCKRVHAELVGAGILRRDDRVVEQLVVREPIAYVVYDRGYTVNVQMVTDYLESQRIHLLGRLGRHRYLNMDDCVRDARELAKRLDGRQR